MEISIDLKFHPGVVTNPRPSLKITARAHRRTPGVGVEEFVHTRLVDCSYPESWSRGLRIGLERLDQLRTREDPEWWTADVEELLGLS